MTRLLRKGTKLQVRVSYTKPLGTDTRRTEEERQLVFVYMYINIFLEYLTQHAVYKSSTISKTHAHQLN